MTGFVYGVWIKHENERARDVPRQAQTTPQPRTPPFSAYAFGMSPADSAATVFNGRVSSSHLGVDYRRLSVDPISP
jgi:hypothetical protein